MPIYAYGCSSCGFNQDVMQKISDAPLSTCPECGKETFAKKLTAASFQLKGSGYYVTDFKNNGARKPNADKSDGEKTGPEKSGASAPAVKTDAGAAASPVADSTA